MSICGFIGMGLGAASTPAAGGAPPFDGGLVVNGNYTLPNSAWNLGSGPDWELGGNAAFSIEGQDGPMFEELDEPVANGVDHELTFDCLSNDEGGDLLIQLYGAVQQTIYQSAPAVGSVGPVVFTSSSANTHIRVRSIDAVPIRITNLRLVAV